VRGEREWLRCAAALHLAGSGAKLFGLPISLALLIPGGLFEITLAIWLLIKGFTPATYNTADATKTAA
jgi:hypothetical protein